jgi:hypothetical protein
MTREMAARGRSSRQLRLWRGLRSPTRLLVGSRADSGRAACARAGLGRRQARKQGAMSLAVARTASQSMPRSAARSSRSPVWYSGTLYRSRRSHGPYPSRMTEMTRPRGSGRGSGGWSAVADLRRLRAHSVIERIPRTHRYHITPGGIRQALFLTRLNQRFLIPGIAQSPAPTRPQTPPSAPPHAPAKPPSMTSPATLALPPETVRRRNDPATKT